MIDLSAVVERRLLVNYRVDPEVAAALLPAGLRPTIVDGSAVAGICLIRLGALRPSLLPLRIGWGGEAAAHRIAASWEEGGSTRNGVFIPIRHAASRLPVLAGGRVLPGVHRRARFRVQEGEGRYRVAVDAADERLAVDVRAASDEWSTPLFPTLQQASDFFRAGAVGWSPDRSGAALEGLSLTSTAWRVRGARVASATSSFFDRLPAGSARLDGALLMTGVPVDWRAVPSRAVLHTSTTAGARSRP